MNFFQFLKLKPTDAKPESHAEAEADRRVNPAREHHAKMTVEMQVGFSAMESACREGQAIATLLSLGGLKEEFQRLLQSSTELRATFDDLAQNSRAKTRPIPRIPQDIEAFLRGDYKGEPELAVDLPLARHSVESLPGTVEDAQQLLKLVTIAVKEIPEGRASMPLSSIAKADAAFREAEVMAQTLQSSSTLLHPRR